jgi:hypothetical protein
MDKKREASDVEDLGLYASYGLYIGSARLASASIPMDGQRIPTANPANWADKTWLADGAFKLGSGQIIAAATLLAVMNAHTERATVSAAISKFEFDPTNAADVLAARAYVWAQHNAPLNYADVPSSGQQLEFVSRSIMSVELAKPGTLYLALQGDKLSGRYIDVAVEDGMQAGSIFESRPRPAKLPAALRLKTREQMWAHHRIPTNVWEKRLDLATLASQAGWRPDSPDNLIALPANAATQAKLATDGKILPIHNSSHSEYDLTVLGEIVIEEEKYHDIPTMTPTQARAILEKVAKEMERQIRTGRWMPKLR